MQTNNQESNRVLPFAPRAAQKEILAYEGGTMGISAVPGSGKTWTLSALAAKIIASGVLQEDQEILVVTLINSAVDNFTRRVSQFLEGYNLIPQVGYRVRTLHGLSHDIVRERPDLVGLDSGFQIIGERDANEIRSSVVRSWIKSNPYRLDKFLLESIDEKRADWVRSDRLPYILESIALSFIRTAKDLQKTPQQLEHELESLPLPLDLALMGLGFYREYNRALAYRGAVDFDDLVRLAYQALTLDCELLSSLQQRWPFILEDEAQDSSKLQESILRLLTSVSGNWVRVGDGNQAIYETFTTANPKYLRDFINIADSAKNLPNSGRSTRSIINLANKMIEWTQTSHPIESVRDALSEPYIEPVPITEQGSNPPDNPPGVVLMAEKFTPADEITSVVNSIKKWLPDHLDETIAVLVPRNQRGFTLIDALVRNEIDVIDSLLRSSTSTRNTAGALVNILRYLADPTSSQRLALVYKVWRRDHREEKEKWKRVEEISKIIRKCTHVEEYLWPQPGKDWLEIIAAENTDQAIIDQLDAFRFRIQVWQQAIHMPVDQIIMTLAQDLFTDTVDMAIAHKLSNLLKSARNSHIDWRLPEFTDELATIAKNERKFLGFSKDESGFDPSEHAGKVVVSTIHKAKGLEWDRVYILSVNNYGFPSGQEYDKYLPEKWFIRDNLNLEAEALGQLEHALANNDYEWYQEGQPSLLARSEYVRERLRLFYVAITRAKKDLIISFNSGRFGKSQAAIPFIALQQYWQEFYQGQSSNDQF